MKTIMIIFSVLGYYFPFNLFSSDEMYLKDTDCMMIGSNGTKIVPMEGSLVDSICIKKGVEITCSHTTKDGKMLGGKPSSIMIYNEEFINEAFSFWNGNGGGYVLNLKDNTYSFGSFFIGKLNYLVSKNCIGIIEKNQDQ